MAERNERRRNTGKFAFFLLLSFLSAIRFVVHPALSSVRRCGGKLRCTDRNLDLPSRCAERGGEGSRGLQSTVERQGTHVARRRRKGRDGRAAPSAPRSSGATLEQARPPGKRFAKNQDWPSSGLSGYFLAHKPEVKELGIRSSWFRLTHEAMNRPGGSGHEKQNNVNT